MMKTTVTPLQAATENLESARIALIEKLTGEAAQNRQEIAAMRQEAKDLNTERVELTQKMRYKEVQGISERISEIMTKVKERELEAVRFEARLRDARELRAPELQALVLTMNHAMKAQHQRSIDTAEDAFRQSVTDAMRNAASALAAASNPDHARRVIFDTLQLNHLGGHNHEF